MYIVASLNSLIICCVSEHFFFVFCTVIFWGTMTDDSEITKVTQQIYVWQLWLIIVMFDYFLNILILGISNFSTTSANKFLQNL